jgi:uncharacterized phage protein gp47/JayE
MITIPTLSQLYNGIVADLEAKFGSNIPAFGKNFLRAFAAVQAGKLKLIYLGIANLQKNSFVDTADPEALGGTLERWGRIKLGRNPFPAQAGQYQVTVTGSEGATISAATTFKSNDDSVSPGKLYILDVQYVLVAGINTITLRALEAGVGSKLLSGDKLTATAPIPGVNRIATVTVESIEPLSEEDIEVYRGKALDAFRLEPQGGAPTDFRLWAKDAQGVKQAYPYARTGAPNEVNLYIEASIVDSIDQMGTPSEQLLAEVEEVIELDPDTTKPLSERGRRPIGIFRVHYLPVTVKQVSIEITGFVGITPTIQTSIFNAVKSEIDRVRPFIAAADILEEKNDILDLNKIILIVLTVRPGSVFGPITLRIDGVSKSAHAFIEGDIPHLSSIIYT